MWFVKSGDNSKSGASGKKLSAALIVMTYCYSHRFCDTSNIATVLGVDAVLIMGLFGINVIDKKKNPIEIPQE